MRTILPTPLVEPVTNGAVKTEDQDDSHLNHNILHPDIHIAILEPTHDNRGTCNDAILLSNEYGKSNSCQDLKNVLEGMGYRHVTICPVTLTTYVNVVRNLVELFKSELVVINLCDGCETDGYPGIGLIKYLEEHEVAFTGADSYFYDITTSKPVLKRLLIEHGVPTSEFVEFGQMTTAADLDALGYPLIVKPSISYASIAISTKSVVHKAQEAFEQAKAAQGVGSGVFAEKFLGGREFTAFVTGDREAGVHVHTVAERVFNPSLAHYERLLAFDTYWDGYTLDGEAPNSSTDKPELYKYAQAPDELQASLKDIAAQAYLALKGNGYGRVDMRTDALDSSKIYVLEVNANCGLSFDVTSFTSTVGEILRMSGEPVSNLALDLVTFAEKRKLRQQST